LKGTGFSPSVKLSKFSGALAFKGCFLNQFCFLAGFVSDSLLKTWFLKKTGFSPSVKPSKYSGALAPEGCFLNQFCFLAGFVSDSLLKNLVFEGDGL